MDILKRNDIQDVATYCGLFLLKEGMTVSPLKLQKILYYVQAWMMVFFEEQLLFDEQPQAWVNGPVYPSVYQRFKSVGRYSQFTKDDFAEGCSLTEAIHKYRRLLGLTTIQQDALDKVIAIYGAKTQDQLVFMTHCEDPWSKARGNSDPFENSDEVISFADMYSYYKDRYDSNRKERMSCQA